MKSIYVVEEKIHGRWYPMIGHGREEFCREQIVTWSKEFPAATFRITQYFKK